MKLRNLSVLSLAAVLLAVSGCIELMGQRLAWFHDEAKDELRILLCYDGIHHDPDRSDPLRKDSDADADDPEALRSDLSRFVSDGDVMLLDWYGRIGRERLREQAGSDENSPVQRKLFDLLSQVEVSVLGTYRGPEREVGAAQRIVIPKVSEFLKAANAVIAEAILGSDELSEAWPLTHSQLRLAAEQQHAFVRLDGQAIVFDIPLDDGELLSAKRLKMPEVVDDLAKDLLPPSKHIEETVEYLRRAVLAVSSIHASWQEGNGHLVIQLGSRREPSILRVELPNQYRDNLLKDVEEIVPQRLTHSLADAALAPDRVTDPALADYLAFGPKEEIVRALAVASSDADATKAAAARSALEAYVKQPWNGRSGYPHLNLGREPLASIGLVDEWYRSLFIARRADQPSKH